MYFVMPWRIFILGLQGFVWVGTICCGQRVGRGFAPYAEEDGFE